MELVLIDKKNMTLKKYESFKKVTRPLFFQNSTPTKLFAQNLVLQRYIKNVVLREAKTGKFKVSLAFQLGCNILTK